MRQINLLPEELQRSQGRRPIIKSVIAAVCLAVFAVLSIHLLLTATVGMLERIERELISTRELPEMSRLREEIARSKLDMRRFIDKNRVPLEILSENLPCPYILKTIGDVTLDLVWLTGFSVDSKNGTCQLDGRSFNTKLVSEFMLELKKVPYFKSVELSSMEKGGEPKKEEVEFKIVCKFK